MDDLLEVEGDDVAEDAAEGERAGEVPARPGRRLDLVALGCYLLGTGWVTLHLLQNVNGRLLAAFPPDQIQFEYWLAHAARVVSHAENPFLTHQLNAPDGVNMMANTSTFALAVPLAPVTLLFGPAVAFAVMVFLGPSGTATGWYWLFSRRLNVGWGPAFVGGACCGFAPGLVAQSNAHPNLAAQFAVPLIVGQLTRLGSTRRWVRDGVLLGLLMAYQFFLNEEMLLITAVGGAVFVAVWAASRRTRARAWAMGFLAGLSVAAGTALLIVGYPLWYQFSGPESYHGMFGSAYWYGADLKGFTAYPTGSLAGSPDSLRLVTNIAEENAFFGVSLLALAVLAAVLLWRRPVARAAAVAAVVLGVVSLGAGLRVDGQIRCTCGPLQQVADLPIVDSVVPTRFALGMAPCIAVLVVLLLNRIREAARPGRRGLRLAAAGCVVTALLPLIPTPLETVDRPAVPPLFATGAWRSFIPDGRALVTIPLTNQDNAQTMAAMQWASVQGLDFPVAGGYFLGPDPDQQDKARYGAPPRPTAVLWGNVAATGNAVSPSPEDRDAARADLRYWRAAVVVLPPGGNEEQLRQVTTDLLGSPPVWVGGVWLWDVRPLVD